MSTTAYDLCSTAWADKRGYVCFSIRDPKQGKSDPGYWTDKIFRWPEDNNKIKSFLDKASKVSKDVYWAPALFSKPKRDKNVALPTDLLWADLDEVDPESLPPHLAPAASWSTSPGRFQALWRLSDELEPDIQSPLNRSLTYKIGADKGGWDLTQVLRLPGTHNMKYKGKPRVGEPHINGARPLNPMKLSTMLVETPGVDDTPVSRLPNPVKVLRQHRRAISTRAKQLLKARPHNAKEGKRSETLWELECLLAEAGLEVEEIVSLVRQSAWNKFSERHDELKRLSAEARKAIAHTGSDTRTSKEKLPEVPEDDEDADEDEASSVEDDFARPQTLRQFDREHEPIRWLVADIWGESEVGFISGHPKSYKSWLSLDLAFSIATGTRFLSTFQAKRANVLLVQEEDPKGVIQERLVQIASAKGFVYCKPIDEDTLEMRYELPENLYVLSGAGFQVTDEDWVETLTEYIKELDIDLVILDPLMMMAEGVDEFKAFDMMSRALKPLKRLRSETKAGVVVVHHHTKTEKQGAAAMYGSVALWAWEEAALHLTATGPGKIVAERFSKHARLEPVIIEVPDIEEAGWKPKIQLGHASQNPDDIITLIESFPDGATHEDLVSATSLGLDAVKRRLRALEKEGKVKSIPMTREPGDRGRTKMKWVLGE